MSSRSGKLVILGGLAVVLAMGVVLVVLTRSTTTANGEPDLPSRSATPPVTSVAPAPPIATPAPHAGTTPAPTPRRSAPTAAPTLAPGLDIGHRDLPRDENGHLVPIINVRLLRAELARTDSPMKACLAKAGAPPNGKATLSFTVAAKNGKLVVESTGVQDEETLAGHPDLLDCMHQTANALAPVLDQNVPPSLGTPIYVRRHVRIENGAIVDNTIFDFSYVP